MTDFILPASSEHTAVFGRNGSGKTVFLTWLLSHASITERPWIIIDHKQDQYLSSIPRINKIKFGELPKHAGLYLMRAGANDDDRLDQYLYSVLARGETGIFTDEGYSMPQREPRYRGFKTVLSQGRSKHVPVLFATQRPSWINKSILSESNYFAAFHLHLVSDKKRALEFMPARSVERLDDYHAHWYDVRRDAYMQIAPVDNDESFSRIDQRLRPRVRML